MACWTWLNAPRVGTGDAGSVLPTRRRAGFKAAGNAGESTSFLAKQPALRRLDINRLPTILPFWQTAPGLPEHVETTERHRMPYLDTGRISLFFEDAGSGGIPVLLLHELGGSSESWREVIPSLTTDRRVIAADFRCAGRSEKPPGSFAISDIAR